MTDTLILAEAVAIDGDALAIILGVLLVMVAATSVYTGVLNVFGYRFARSARTRDGVVWAAMCVPVVVVVVVVIADGGVLTAVPLGLLGTNFGYVVGRLRGQPPAGDPAGGVEGL